MRLRVDQTADAIHLKLTEHQVDVSEEISPGIVVDFDANGKIVGIEILNASKQAGDDTVLQSLQLDLPKAS